VFGVLLSLVVAQTVLVRNQDRLDRLDREIAEAREWNQRARLKVDQAEAPQAIVNAARDRLGLVQPEQPTYLTPTPEAVAEVLEAQRRALAP
jgi:hypothetical protein